MENGNKIISNNATLTYRQTQNSFISGKKWCEAERHEGVKKIMMNEIENMEKIIFGFFSVKEATEINKNSIFSIIGFDRISLLIGAYYSNGTLEIAHKHYKILHFNKTGAHCSWIK